MRWIPFVNLIIVALIVLSIGGIVFLSSQKSPMRLEPLIIEEPTFPQNPFQVADLSVIEQGPFALKWVAPHMQLPNLQNAITYYGMSERPDCQQFHISFAGSNSIFSINPKDELYLSYDLESGSYRHSEEPTSLWLELEPQRSGRALQVSVYMTDENGQVISDPPKHQYFSLNALELPKTRVASWTLDDYRVDSTLLIRQKARWIGADLFLRTHGGDDFVFVSDRERIDFFSGETPYSCFVKKGDYLIWKEKRWQLLGKGESAKDFPLLVVKNIEEKVISFDLWDPEGKSKTFLNLIRSKDLNGLPNVAQDFRFVGAKTWAQFIVEYHTQRLVLKPHDWLVLTNEGWIKLDSPQQVDDYVNQRIVGPLLILDKMGKRQGRQVLVGHLFNATRTEIEPIELIATTNASLANYSYPPSLMDTEEMQGGEE